MWKSSRILKVLILLLAVLALSPPALSARKASCEQYLQELHAKGKERVIVRFNNQPDKSTIAKYNAKLIRELKIINALVCEIDQTAIESLKRQPNIKDVIPDIVIRIPEPIERKAPPQTIAPLSYQGPVTIPWENLEAGVNSKAAWDRYNLDGTEIKVAFLDTGINYLMPNLGGGIGSGFKCLGGYDFVDNDVDPINPTSNETHGTEVVSVGVGQGVTDGKVVGVAYNAKYYAIRVMQENIGLVSDAIAGIEWASTEPHKADIISMSFASYDSESHPDIIALRNACDAAYNADIILLAGSGNDGYTYSAWPAGFENVISVGGHAEDQSLYNYGGYSSNGGVDVVAPGSRVYTVDPDNSAWWVWGTSMAAPHASGLLALQLQYARQNNMQPNNGYLWEVMKHSAVDLGLNPVYQGKGKIYAARTDINDANVGSIDLMAVNWPIDHNFNFSDYAFTEPNYPVYLTGTDINQTITLTNITDVLGNAVENIENLVVTATAVYCDEPNEPNLPGDSNITFPVITLLEPNDANSIILNWVYTLPANATPGLVKTKLAFEFNFAGNPRIIKITFNEPNSLWYAAIPADLDLSNTVDFLDFSKFSTYWQQTECNESNNWCNGADINHSSAVDLSDLSILTENWMRAL